MCAMMPMLRQCSSGKVRATAKYLVNASACAPGDRMNECLGKNGLTWAGRGLLHAPGRCVNMIVPTGDQAGLRLPPVVGERLVGLRHLVRVLALLHCVAAVVRGVHQLCGEILVHGLLAALLGVLDQPAHGESDPAL